MRCSYDMSVLCQSAWRGSAPISLGAEAEELGCASLIIPDIRLVYSGYRCHVLEGYVVM